MLLSYSFIILLFPHHFITLLPNHDIQLLYHLLLTLHLLFQLIIFLRQNFQYILYMILLHHQSIHRVIQLLELSN